MALQTVSMGGGAVAMPSFGGGVAVPHQFQSFASAPKTQASRGAGGAYDLRNNQEAASSSDGGPCLGMDIDESCAAFVWVEGERGGEAASITGDKRLPTVLFVDAKSGVRGLRRWLGKAGRAAALPKGVSVFERGDVVEGQEIGGLVRLVGLRQRTDDDAEAERAARGDELALPAASAEMDDTSRIQVRVVSPEAKEEKDRELMCLAEDLLGLVVVALKLRAEEKLQLKVSCCVAAVPACFTDQQRVSLQRAIFSAGLTPRRFIAAPLATAVAAEMEAAAKVKRDAAQLRARGEALGQEDAVLVSVSVGASHTDVCLIRTGSIRTGSTAKEAASAAFAGGFVALACSGDPTAGAEDIDIRLARSAAALAANGAAAATKAEEWHAAVSAARKERELLFAAADQGKGKGGKDGGDEAAKVSLKEVEEAAAATAECLREAVAHVLDKAGTAKGVVSQLLISGACTSNSSMFDVLLEAFPNATVVRPQPTAAALGACLAMAAESGRLQLPFRAIDALPADVGITGSEAGKAAEPDVLFSSGVPLPARTLRTFVKSDPNRASLKDVRVVQRLLACGGGPSGGGRAWARVVHLGDPLLVYDRRDNPVIANRVVVELSVDACGLVSHQVLEEELPESANRDALWKWINRLSALAAVATALWAGYRQLNAMAMAPQLEMERARARLTELYTIHNPDKLDSVEATVTKYYGRYDTLYKRLEEKYDMKF